MGWIERTSFRTVDVSVNDQNDLDTKLQEILSKWNTKQIISVNPTTPNTTDTLYWYKVYYEYYI